MLLSKSAQNCLFLEALLFVWTERHVLHVAFTTLKSELTQAPILVYFQLRVGATSFVVQTDASAVGLAIGAVLEQDNRVIAYASRALSKSECNYSTIQKECLAIVFAMKQFCHYFLGCPFTLMTDHAPLQWLSAQKMEGPLLSVALALQEYTFTIIVHCKGILNDNADALSRLALQEYTFTIIVYCKGILNNNADALSRWPPDSPPLPVVVTSTTEYTIDLQQAQLEDPVLQQVQQALSQSHETPNTATWHHSPLKRYRQLWHQLSIIDGIVCRTYQPGPASGVVKVPLMPTRLHQEALQQSHDTPSVAHQGSAKTLARLQQQAYWVGMAKDVQLCTVNNVQHVNKLNFQILFEHHCAIFQLVNHGKC